MDRFLEMQTFCSVVDAGSFVKAADVLGMSKAAALAHQGVILQPSFLVGDDLAAGTLVELMPELRSIELGIYAVYPTRKHVSPKVRALIDFLAERFAQTRTKW